MIKKLRVKFVAILMLVVACLLGVSFGFFYTLTRQNLRTQSISMMQAIAANPLEPVLPDAQPQQVRLPYFVLQMDKFGTITAVNAGSFDLSDHAFLERIARTALAGNELTGEIPEYNLRFCRVMSSGVQSVIFADTTSEQQTLKGLVRSGAAIIAVSLLAFFGLALLLARWAVRPVEDAWEQQKQFVADASHELKTPLTVILTNTELLQSGDFDEEHRRQFMSGIAAMAQQMRALVERLLELARMESGKPLQNAALLDLSALTEDSALVFEAALYERGLTLETQIEPEIAVMGDGQQLRQLVEIYLDNAGKYAAGGTVTVALHRCGHASCRLSVENEGEPLSSEQLRDVFKRFYRADSARTRTGSFGLGLSIAQAVAAAHHGRVWAESRDGHNLFFAELPTAGNHEKQQERRKSGI